MEDFLKLMEEYLGIESKLKFDKQKVSGFFTPGNGDEITLRELVFEHYGNNFLGYNEIIEDAGKAIAYSATLDKLKEKLKASLSSKNQTIEWIIRDCVDYARAQLNILAAEKQLTKLETAILGDNTKDDIGYMRKFMRGKTNEKGEKLKHGHKYFHDKSLGMTVEFNNNEVTLYTEGNFDDIIRDSIRAKRNNKPWGYALGFTTLAGVLSGIASTVNVDYIPVLITSIVTFVISGIGYAGVSTIKENAINRLHPENNDNREKKPDPIMYTGMEAARRYYDAVKK